MKIWLCAIVSLLLLFNGAGAIFGGLNLITHPDGSGMHLSLVWLKYSPFNDYLIPGIVLLISNGLLSILAFIFLLLNYRNYAWFVTAQGAILTGWILIQVMMMRTINSLHVILGAIGIMLLTSGFLLLMNKSRIRKYPTKI